MKYLYGLRTVILICCLECFLLLWLWSYFETFTCSSYCIYCSCSSLSSLTFLLPRGVNLQSPQSSELAPYSFCALSGQVYLLWIQTLSDSCHLHIVQSPEDKAALRAFRQAHPTFLWSPIPSLCFLKHYVIRPDNKYYIEHLSLPHSSMSQG